tara:strand:- start:11111 stop:11362 length:252 start_codon:yes stop_codon:yes gene_type:complete
MLLEVSLNGNVHVLLFGCLEINFPMDKDRDQKAPLATAGDPPDEFVRDALYKSTMLWHAVASCLLRKLVIAMLRDVILLLDDI